MRRRDEYGIVLAVSFGIAPCSLLTAVLASDACGGDDTFDPDGPGALPSQFCKDTHFPGVPDSRASWMVFGAYFLTPALISLVAGLLGVATQRRWLRLAGAYLGLPLMVGVAVFAAFNAEIGYAAG